VPTCVHLKSGPPDGLRKGEWWMARSIRVGTVFGIQVYLHYSWFLVFGAVAFTLGFLYFPTYHVGWSVYQYWVIGTLTAVLFFGSVLIHELAHSLIALYEGIQVKDITLFIFGGVSNIQKEADSPGVEFRIAVAGPAASVALSILFLALWFLTRRLDESVGAMSIYLATVNGLLAGFNMIPGFPLDGGRVFRSVLWKITNSYQRATWLASGAGRLMAYLFVLGGLALFVAGNWVNGGWLVMLGWFLANAAGSSYRQSMVNEALRGVSVADMMARDCPIVEEQVLLSDLMRDYVLRYNFTAFPVLRGTTLVGLITIDNLRTVPQDQWVRTRVSQVMTTVERLKTVNPWDEALHALQQFGERSESQLPVVDEGRLVGLLSRSKLLQFIQLREKAGAGR